MTAEDSDIYHDLMRFKPPGVSPNAWAVRAGVSRTVWADMRRHGNPSRRTLEKLLIAADSSLAEFEALRVGAERGQLPPGGAGLGDARSAWRAAPLQPLPLIGSRLAGEWAQPGSRIELTEIDPDEVLERLARPVSLAFDQDAFALTIVGDSMWPRFAPGKRIAVSPRAPVAIGDDVLVRLRHEGVTAGPRQVLIKQLVGRSAGELQLRQFKPDRTFAVAAEMVDGILKVPGELI